MKAYAIKRDDGKYYHQDSFGWVDKLYMAELYSQPLFADDYMIKHRKLENCKIVQVEIKECEDE